MKNTPDEEHANQDTYSSIARKLIDEAVDKRRKQVIRDLIAELEGDRKLVYPDAEWNHEINEIVIWWLEEKL